MENQTWSGDVLLLEGLKVTPQYSFPVFFLLLLLYIFIMVSNIGLTVLICMERSLHQPMYLLFCNLCINDVLGATAIIPHLLSNIFTASANRYISYIGTVLTYVKIAIACLTSKNRVLNKRALQTCTTHLALYLIMMVSDYYKRDEDGEEVLQAWTLPQRLQQRPPPPYRLASPLHRPTEAGRPYVWDNACATAFARLQAVLTEASVLAYLDACRPFIIDADAN
ncbi:unnamed protein product [Arctogadus glacialis]